MRSTQHSADREAEAFAVERREHGLTTTSYAVLGLLAMREWTAYELAQQMQRSVSYFWPRAARRIYDEPRRLESAGYIEGRREQVGRRPRTCWVITDKGRAALRCWLGEQPSEVPLLEFDGMLKVFLAPYAGKQQLLDTLATIRESAHHQRRQLAVMSAEAAEDGSEFAERVHVNALAMAYMVQLSELTDRWAREAETTVRTWRSTTAPGPQAREAARAAFASYASTVPESHL